ncbi:MAG: carbohydrate kinase family protein [Fuerstiella sp.]|nr:carbohydrate kinase family protein [Fuerstiella sp.]
MAEKPRAIDCIVCGEICVDLPVSTVDRSRPLIELPIGHVDPILPGSGGIVANSGMAMTRLGLRTSAFGCVGDDLWGRFLRERLAEEGVETSHLVTMKGRPSSVTVVVGGDDGEHTFLFHAGASQRFNRSMIEQKLEVFKECQYALFGYYALMPALENELSDVFRQLQGTGCQIAMDTAGGGGSMTPLNRILPHVNIYIPSLIEAQSQTKQRDPRSMIEFYRRYAPNALLGIKLGNQGAILSPADGEWIHIDPVTPPGVVIDTTGAGDCFYAGLITGLVRGRSIEESGRLAAAAGACSVTQTGAVNGLGDLTSLLQLAHA